MYDIETIFIVIFVIIFLVVLALVFKRYVLPQVSIPNWLGGYHSAQLNQYQSGDESIICDKTSKLLSKFLTDKLSDEEIIDAENLASDLVFDLDNVKIPKTSADSLCAKLILDTILQFYVYKHKPTATSRKYADSNIKYIKQIIDEKKTTCFTEAQVNSLQKIMSTLSHTAETKSDDNCHREYFRKSNILEHYKKTSEDPTLRDELSRKNIELRDSKDEIDRLKRDISRFERSENRERRVGSITDGLLLEDCQRERRSLTDKVYELRREIDSLRNSGIRSSDIQNRVDELRRRNSELESQISSLEQSKHTEMNEIARLRRESAECQNVLNDVLNAQTI